MTNFLNYLNLVNLIHILLIAPLLIVIGTGNFPPQYNQLLLILAGIVVIYHLYRLFSRPAIEGMHVTTMGYVNVKDTDGAHIVRMFDSAPGYSTPFLNVKVGETVRWINTGEQSHTVTDVDDKFNSGVMMPGDVYEIKFTTPGNYTYFSVDNYGWMRGQITVNF